MTHITVLLDEAVHAVVQSKEGFYVDGTYGRGGHSRALLQQLNDHGRLLVMDKDPTAIAHATQWALQDQRVVVAHDSFAQLGQWVERLGWQGQVKGVLLDLGVSSPQLDEPERGFSFLQNGPLDMRMNPHIGISAAQWLNSAGETEIADVIYQFGEERYSRRIAKAIVDAREKIKFELTQQLAEVVAAAHPRWEKGKHPATRTFQAIRIFVNNELIDLEVALKATRSALCMGGRLVVISFHSLEDRMVKRFIANEGRKNIPKGLPIAGVVSQGCFKKMGKAVRASEQEVKSNARARSAIMRIAEKIG